MKRYEFPAEFLWGAATSSHQVEGNTHNDWSEWEHAKANQLSKTARERLHSESVAVSGQKHDVIPPEALTAENYISGIAADHFNRYEEDFDLAKSLGHNTHRFSIEWSRIEPEEGKWNQEAIEHYVQVVAALRARGLEPFVTLWHWTMPIWLAKKGGVESRGFPAYFERFVRMMVEALKKDVIYFTTLNEPTSVIVNSYLFGNWPPQKKSLLSALRVFHRLAGAHKRAYAAIHKLHPAAQVGPAHAVIYSEPHSPRLLDRLSASFSGFISNHYFMRLIGNTTDFIGIQYYFHQRIAFPNHIHNENERVSDMGWELYPHGLTPLLISFQKYGKPIYITESGLADAQDQHRIWYLTETLKAIHVAIEQGVDVRGYLHWSLLDNFEWDKGFWPHFGLISVDRTTLKRTPRASALYYKTICETNQLEEQTP